MRGHTNAVQLRLIRQALETWGYRFQASHRGSLQTDTSAFETYANRQGTVIILQIYRQQMGYALYHPLTTTLSGNTLAAQAAETPV